MSFNAGFSKDRGEMHDRVQPRAGQGTGAGPNPDPEMARVLDNFRHSVHAWSGAMFQRSRQFEFTPRRTAWQRSAAWALGIVLMSAGVGAGLLEYQHRQEQARIAAAREAGRQRQLQEERAREAEQELAQVDRDVSREVPDALEPLASLMTADESQ